MSFLFPQSSRSPNISELIDLATSETIPLGTEDLAQSFEICDLIRSKTVTAKDAVKALKSRTLYTKNPNVQIHALKLTDLCVKNGGWHFLLELSTFDFIDPLVGLLRLPNLAQPVRCLVLQYIQSWATAFQQKPELSYVCLSYESLRSEGCWNFPPLQKDDQLGGKAIMIDTNSPPEWTDSENCAQCRSSFNFMKRKHHCRSCGFTICQSCSSNSIPLPKFGINQDVRVCDACFSRLGKPSDLKGKDVSNLVGPSGSSSVDQLSQNKQNTSQQWQQPPPQQWQQPSPQQWQQLPPQQWQQPPPQQWQQPPPQQRQQPPPQQRQQPPPQQWQQPPPQQRQQPPPQQWQQPPPQQWQQNPPQQRQQQQINQQNWQQQSNTQQPSIQNQQPSQQRIAQQNQTYNNQNRNYSSLNSPGQVIIGIQQGPQRQQTGQREETAISRQEQEDLDLAIAISLADSEATNQQSQRHESHSLEPNEYQKNLNTTAYYNQNQTINNPNNHQNHGNLQYDQLRSDGYSIPSQQQPMQNLKNNFQRSLTVPNSLNKIEIQNVHLFAQMMTAIESKKDPSAILMNREIPMLQQSMAALQPRLMTWLHETLASYRELSLLHNRVAEAIQIYETTLNKSLLGHSFSPAPSQLKQDLKGLQPSQKPSFNPESSPETSIKELREPMYTLPSRQGNSTLNNSQNHVHKIPISPNEQQNVLPAQNAQYTYNNGSQAQKLEEPKYAPAQQFALPTMEPSLVQQMNCLNLNYQRMIALNQAFQLQNPMGPNMGTSSDIITEKTVQNPYNMQESTEVYQIPNLSVSQNLMPEAETDRQSKDFQKTMESLENLDLTKKAMFVQTGSVSEPAKEGRPLIEL